MIPPDLRQASMAELRAAVDAADNIADLEALAAELERRRTASAEKVAAFARNRARALKAVATRRAREVLSLVPFLCRQGGVRDDGGEVSALTGTKRHRLIRADGLSLDRACERALEAGYFPEHEVAGGRGTESLAAAIRYGGRDAETMTVAALLDAIDAELRGRLRWPKWHEPPAPEQDSEQAEHEAASEDRAHAALWREAVELARAEGCWKAWPFLVEKGGVDLAELSEIPF